MKRIQAIDPPELVRPSGYSHGIFASPGASLHVAGQVAGLLEDGAKVEIEADAVLE